MEQQMIFSVSEANNFIKALLDRVPQLQEIFVRGEISNYKLYPSGHHYFTLKDAEGAMRCVLPASGVMLVGLIAMYFARGMAAVIVAGCVMMSGYMLVTAVLSGSIRDYTPKGKVGHFQGIRMIFGVLLPMVIGPAVGAAVIKGSDSTYVELGVVKTVPTPAIFLAAAAALLLILPPVLALKKEEMRMETAGEQV